ncbi:hypothetical protein BDQ17DRAFT_1367353 [Cyathus striatus]|nr:hypothetical protein BDQ17DRAFT_1367353 [Cyathus striatus]
MDIDDEDALDFEEFQRLQAYYAHQFHLLEEEEQLLYTSADMIGFGIEESHRIQTEQRKERRLYLTRPNLLPNPRVSTPWT